jgi:hypothetical protein
MKRRLTDVIDRLIDKLSIRDDDDCRRLIFELKGVKQHAAYVAPEAFNICWIEAAQHIERAFGPVEDLNAWQRDVYAIWMGEEDDRRERDRSGGH